MHGCPRANLEVGTRAGGCEIRQERALAFAVPDVARHPAATDCAGTVHVVHASMTELLARGEELRFGWEQRGFAHHVDRPLAAVVRRVAVVGVVLEADEVRKAGVPGPAGRTQCRP